MLLTSFCLLNVERCDLKNTEHSENRMTKRFEICRKGGKKKKNENDREINKKKITHTQHYPFFC